MESNQDIEQLSINTVRILSADGVQKANSGHPGMPMGAAPMGHVLYSHAMKFSPAKPQWPNRDRFILSAGHGSMLQYSLLHLTGFNLSLDDLKNFRQMGSKTPGHPEYGLTEGVDVTTGPLGQGFANGVGFAIAQKHLAAKYNKPGFELFDYKIFAICSDGDMMEGVTSEAASMAGHLKLGNLIYLYDDNNISIEGDTGIAFTEDVAKRFEAYDWHVQVVTDGNDIEALKKAVDNAVKETSRPSLIKVKTQIAFGSPNKVNTAGSHGSPLGDDELKLVKKGFGFDPDKSFYIPSEVKSFYENSVKHGVKAAEDWDVLFKKYKEEHKELAEEFEMLFAEKVPSNWSSSLPVFAAGEKMATRKASGKVLNAIADSLPGLLGGSADLSPSTDTILKKFESFSADNYGGRNFHFGIREHAMGSAINGMALTKGLIPYGATFLIFSEYMRPPVRLAAIMKIKSIFIYTHDSIGLGEDGTTHQPVEQLISLRSIPNLLVLRPADANETAFAWKVAVEHKGGPVSIVLSRQDLPVLDQDKFAKASGLEKGAYILSEAKEEAQLILIGTGSEVHLLLDVQEKLAQEGIHARVVSMPSWELFNKQDQGYKDQVLPPSHKKRISVETGSSLGWHKYTGDEGLVIGLDTFGESAPASELMKHFGFTADSIIEKAKSLIK